MEPLFAPRNKSVSVDVHEGFEGDLSRYVDPRRRSCRKRSSDSWETPGFSVRSDLPRTSLDGGSGSFAGCRGGGVDQSFEARVKSSIAEPRSSTYEASRTEPSVRTTKAVRYMTATWSRPTLRPCGSTGSRCRVGPVRTADGAVTHAACQPASTGIPAAGFGERSRRLAVTR